MQRRVTAQDALLRLQDISVDSSDGEHSDSEHDDELINDVEIDFSDREDSDSSNEDDDSDLQNPVKVNQDLIEKDGTAWQVLAGSHKQRGRLQQQNILNFKPSPTAYATSRIIESSPLLSFRVLFDEAMLRSIKKCAVAEAHCVLGRTNWDVTLDELDKFIGLLIAGEILGERGLPLESLWNSSWGCTMFNNTLSRNRFKEIMRFLRFDIKSDRRQRVVLDEFCLASSLQNSFIENC